MLETITNGKDFHKRVSASRRGRRMARFRACGVGLVALATVSAAAAQEMTPDEFDLWTRAIADNNRAAVEELLAKGVSPNVPDLKGWTAIHRAASNGAVANLYASLRAGGKLKLNAADRNGDTPLHLAASAGADEFTIKTTSRSAETIQLLLEEDAIPDPVNGEGKTPLHHAAFSHRPVGGATGVEALLRAGADPNRADRKGNTPLHAAVMGAMDARIVGALLDGGASTESVNRDRLTPLLLFVRVGSNDGQIASRLLDAGANPDRKFPNGKTPLHVAVDRNTWEVVDALLAANADPCIRDSEGFTPYNAAPEGGRMHQALGRAKGGDGFCDERTDSADAQATEEALGLTREQRRRIQRGLAAEGHDPGPADGAFGPRTRTAILDWQKARSGGKQEKATGYLTRDGADALMTLGAKEASRQEAGSVFRDCVQCPEMVVVPAGSFVMGSPSSEAGRNDDEGPQRRVTIGSAFAVGKHEVTRGEYGRFVSETGHSSGDSCWVFDGKWKERSGYSWKDPGFDQSNDHPVACVSWNDAKRYVRWLSGKTGERYRLLSEAEWEYAARAGTTGPYHTGGTISAGQANYGRNNDGTVPVGRYGSNGFGLHDMHGNVWEWVEDCWSGDCGKRVLRGGSWLN